MKIDVQAWQQQASAWLDILLSWLASPQFYAQIIAIIVALFVARLMARQALHKIVLLRDAPAQGRFLKIRQQLYDSRDLLLPLLRVLLLALAVMACDAAVSASWAVRIAQSLSVIFLLYAAINRFIKNPMINLVARWVGIPLAALAVFGYFDDAMVWLDGLAFSAGNIRISALAIAKAAIFGGILFWLGRTSSTAGQKVIRDQQAIDIQTRELVAKFFEIAIFFVVGVLLLNILGLDLTALAVFGGALGVGLGFGLQQIASNFISGIIILFERSIKVGDYIEFEDGKAGILREINMRSSALATYDGKDIMVPNERFITTMFTNWTKTDPHQRYEVAFSVTYDTDLHQVPKLVADAVATHPMVLSEPAPPDVELRGFGDNGVNFAVEFWVAGIDDGKHKFSSDVHFLVWDALKGAGIAMPFPQREVRILGDSHLVQSSRKARP